MRNSERNTKRQQNDHHLPLLQRELGVALREVEYEKPVVLLGLRVMVVDVFYLGLILMYL